MENENPPAPDAQPNEGNQREPEPTRLTWPFCALIFAVNVGIRLLSPYYSLPSGAEETYGGWEPLHLLLYDSGVLLRGYAPEVAGRSWGLIVLHWAIAGPLDAVLELSPIRVMEGVRFVMVLCHAFGQSILTSGLMYKKQEIGTLYFIIATFHRGLNIASFALLPAAFSLWTNSAAFGFQMLGYPALALLFGMLGLTIGLPAAGLPLLVSLCLECLWRVYQNGIVAFWNRISQRTLRFAIAGLSPLLLVIAIDRWIYGRFVVLLFNQLWPVPETGLIPYKAQQASSPWLGFTVMAQGNEPPMGSSLVYSTLNGAKAALLWAMVWGVVALVAALFSVPMMLSEWIGNDLHRSWNERNKGGNVITPVMLFRHMNKKYPCLIPTYVIMLYWLGITAFCREHSGGIIWPVFPAVCMGAACLVDFVLHQAWIWKPGPTHAAILRAKREWRWRTNFILIQLFSVSHIIFCISGYLHFYDATFLRDTLANAMSRSLNYESSACERAAACSQRLNLTLPDQPPKSIYPRTSKALDPKLTFRVCIGGGDLSTSVSPVTPFISSVSRRVCLTPGSWFRFPGSFVVPQHSRKCRSWISNQGPYARSTIPAATLAFVDTPFDDFQRVAHKLPIVYTASGRTPSEQSVAGGHPWTSLRTTTFVSVNDCDWIVDFVSWNQPSIPKWFEHIYAPRNVTPLIVEANAEGVENVDANVSTDSKSNTNISLDLTDSTSEYFKNTKSFCTSYCKKLNSTPMSINTDDIDCDCKTINTDIKGSNKTSNTHNIDQTSSICYERKTNNQCGYTDVVPNMPHYNIYQWVMLGRYRVADVNQTLDLFSCHFAPFEALSRCRSGELILLGRQGNKVY
jgi:hypothetical protein